MNAIIAWLIGISLVILIKSTTMVNDIQSNTVFVAELAENVLPGQRITAESLLKDDIRIKKSSVELISALRAQKSMLKEMPEIEYMSSNPFRDIIVFKTSGLKNSNVEEFVNELTNIQGIEKVYFDEEFLRSIPHSVQRIKSGLLITSLFFLLGGIVALVLRVKRDLRTHNESMRIMSLAGSEDFFILSERRFWSLKWGLISACLAIAFIVINILFINLTLFNDLEITFLQSVLAILIMLFIVVSVQLLTTQITITSFLNRLNPNLSS